jgi:hypothetical protein
LDFGKGLKKGRSKACLNESCEMELNTDLNLPGFFRSSIGVRIRRSTVVCLLVALTLCLIFDEKHEVVVTRISRQVGTVEYLLNQFIGWVLLFFF